LDCVHVLRVGREPIAAVVAHDDVADRGPEIRHVRLQRRPRSRGRPLAPNTVNQRVDRDRLPHLGHQQRKHGALLPSAEVDVGAVACDLERPQDANLHVGFKIRPFVAAAKCVRFADLHLARDPMTDRSRNAPPLLGRLTTRSGGGGSGAFLERRVLR
jgi:hypothetical protein